MTSGEEIDDGVPVVELPISDADVPAPTHLRRSLRYTGEADIDPPGPSRQPSTSEP